MIKPWLALLVSTLLYQAPVLASEPVSVCAEWRKLDRKTKADFIVNQSQAFLTEGGTGQWLKSKTCFNREAPDWIHQIDKACVVDGPMNSDVGMAMGALVAKIWIVCNENRPAPHSKMMNLPTEQFISERFNYSFEYDPASWTKSAKALEPGVEVMLECNICEPGANLTVAVTYDAATRDVDSGQLADLLSGEIVTRQVRNSPLVSDFKIIGEGAARLGNLQAFEVKMTYSTSRGSRRYRHSVVAFDKGRFFNISVHSHPDRHDLDFEYARTVLNTFQIN